MSYTILLGQFYHLFIFILLLLFLVNSQIEPILIKFYEIAFIVPQLSFLIHSDVHLLLIFYL